MPSLYVYDVIRRPLITEKSNGLMADNNQYVFEVASTANKVQIREAVESLFEVKVAKVATMVMPAKRGRRGRKWYKRSKQWKKAIVTLQSGDSIGLFNV